MAHAHWFVQVPGLWRCANSDTYADTLRDTDTNAYANTNSDAHSDTAAGCAQQSDSDCGFADANQFGVD